MLIYLLLSSLPMYTSMTGEMQNIRTKIDIIKHSLPLSSIIGRFQEVFDTSNPLKFRCLCPFHDDTIPSLLINDDLNFYHCFSCGASGDVITYIQNIQNVNFVAALNASEDMLMSIKNYDALKTARSSMQHRKAVNSATLKATSTVEVIANRQRMVNELESCPVKSSLHTELPRDSNITLKRISRVLQHASFFYMMRLSQVCPFSYCGNLKHFDNIIYHSIILEFHICYFKRITTHGMLASI